ncbi:hypothetical protein AcV5_000680 [Taiwanofungus camphoratus]|nr:hypothetical protein AcV5_000680 [Antrodia cinnamomea]
MSLTSFILEIFLLAQVRDRSALAVLSLWILRVVSLSLVFRAYIGPSIISLVSKRLRVRSVSLRSIRGIYFRAGNGTWRVDRVGLSYHRPLSKKDSRFSILVEGLKIEVTKGEGQSTQKRPSVQNTFKRPIFAQLAPSPLAYRVWTIVWFIYTAMYTLLDPYVRPVVRTVFVAALRMVIRALPALTHVLDLELQGAVITFSAIPGIELGVEEAKLNTTVSLSSLESVVFPDNKPRYQSHHRHKRFASVADWNARLTSSLRRTWDRAWGATQVAASASFQIKSMTGCADSFVIKDLPRASYGGGRAFVNVPFFDFSVAVRVNPHKGLEPHSLETTLHCESLDINIDVVQHLLGTIQRHRDSKKKCEDRELKSPLSPTRPASSRLTWSSQMSPTSSPMMGALSMRLRWGNKPGPIHRLNSQTPTSRLSILKAVSISVTKLTLSHCPPHSQMDIAQTFKATVNDIHLSAALSHPDTNSMHREWLGSRSVPGDELSADVYRFNFTMHLLTLERIGHETVDDHLQVISTGPLQIYTIVSQWPLPWVRGPSFMSGDPNAQLLAINVVLGTVQLTERLEVFQTLLAREKPAKPHLGSESLLPVILAPVPRIALGLQVGSIFVRLISSSTEGEDRPFALEARTDGFVASITSQYTLPSDECLRSRSHDGFGLHMDIDHSFILDRTFVNVCFGTNLETRHSQGLLASGPSGFPGETLLSLDTVQLTGRGSAIGDIPDQLHSGVTVDVTSLFTDVQCSSEAISVELWQPDIIKTVSRLARCLETRSRKDASLVSPHRLLDKLPFGLAASLSIGRFVLFVTAPDLAPDEQLGISRGVASHMGISASYCAIHNKHSDRIQNLLSRGQKRLRLSLPTEQIVKAVAGTTAPAANPSLHVLSQIMLWDIGLRDAVATQFTADDPYCIGDKDDELQSRQFLRIRDVNVEVTLSGQRPGGSPRPGVKDDCNVTVSTSSIRGSICLAQVYSILLATQTFKSLLPRTSKERADNTPSTLSVSVQSALADFQVLWDFPIKTKLFTRVTAIDCLVSPEQKVAVRWDSVVLAVSLPSVHDSAQREEWEELARLPDWRIDVLPHARPISISVQGESGRVRIPFDFVPADLILDINVTIKCIRNLTRIVALGQYQKPPTPVAEAAKIVPSIFVKIQYLSLEAADEDIETKLGLIWRAGFEASRIRREREDAFRAKVTTILTSNSPHFSSGARDHDADFQFSSKHTVSIAEARQRLLQVHSVAWRSGLQKAQSLQIRRQGDVLRRFQRRTNSGGSLVASLVSINPPKSVPPLCRMTFDGLSLHLTPPSFPSDALPDFLHAVGSGLPRDTEFSLLIPVHLNFTIASLRLAYREYPLPLLNVPPSSEDNVPALEFDSDVVIAEEMGTAHSVEWISCDVIKPNSGIHGSSPLTLPIPKTIMPVKTYARPIIRVLTDDVTDFAWGISYSPVTQDLMRIMDTLSHAPRDSSPPVGFWDKLRLVFHWQMQVFFEHEVHLHMKGSRDPFELGGNGAGFALCWLGNPQLLVGQQNDENELIQMISETMLVVIPNVEDAYGDTSTIERYSHPRVATTPTATTLRPRKPRKYQKVCAKFSSGVRFGVGFVLERSCGPECHTCTGKAFERRCRFFDFCPHYNVKLEEKTKSPEYKSKEDSYNGFRSDFIHMSISLTSALHVRNQTQPTPSSLHLSPEVFAHFWAWWSLFNGALSLPIRQGSQHSRKRPVSPKFGQHLATLKYRIFVPQLFISHVYIDNSKDAWTDGVTPFVGVKAFIDQFQADLHQRDQESSRLTLGGPKTVHHKPFHAIEVVLKGLDLRSMLATFTESLKKQVNMESSPLVSNYRAEIKAAAIAPGSPWLDLDDFGGTEWSSAVPTVHLFPIASCPRFTYFKRPVDHGSRRPDSLGESSKFGTEDTHVCFLGKEASVTQVQIGLTSSRIDELQRKLAGDLRMLEERAREGSQMSDDYQNQTGETTNDLRKNIALLENYASHLRKVDAASYASAPHGSQNYYMPSDTVSPEEWAEFDNVYQVHSPQIFMDNTIRDLMLQYYHCSRSKRGIEYHMATRAVKFIRDQAQAALANVSEETESSRGPVASAQAAAVAVRNFLIGDSGPSTNVETSPQQTLDNPGPLDPLDGWSEGVSLRKSHFYLLLKPQVVLRSESSTDSVCVLAAVQGKLQNFAIMDNSNMDDPVSGKIMSRNFASLSGLQTFSPSAMNQSGEGYVPLEVLIDLRCANSAFERLVPQTDATFHYDKFNRLRLRNNITSIAQTSQQSDDRHKHLQSQTDLVRLHVPRFTISANDRHFQAISNILTNLLLFSDAASKDRSDKLEKMLFSYDFTNLASAADVVANMQARLRHAIDTKREAVSKLRDSGNPGRIEILKIDAHVLLLAEELNLIFDAIKLAQDKANDHPEQKSALLLHASSSEVSWRMLDQQDQLIAKLAVRDSHFYWLNRHDSSTVNTLAVGDLQAFDGSADAEWTEILAKYDEPSTHPLVKRKLFLLADWTVRPPVGGIAIYETFELTFHPMRLQIDTRIGRKIMEYVWPARRNRSDSADPQSYDPTPESPTAMEDSTNALSTPGSARRSSYDLPPSRKSQDSSRLTLTPLRRLGPSRSFTDLRGARSDTLQVPPKLHKTRSTDALEALSTPTSQMSKVSADSRERIPSLRKRKEIDDAAEMKTRSSAKTFIWVKVASLHLMLSIMKEDSFLCRDARIRTRDLEYRNQTLSFEELADQFIPSDRNWRGWLKMAFQQPLVPVLPVARELITKTKWMSSKHHQHHEEQGRSSSPRLLPFTGRQASSESKRPRIASNMNLLSRSHVPIVTPGLTAEPGSMGDSLTDSTRAANRHGRQRMLSVFKRRHTTHRTSLDSDTSNASTTTPSRPLGHWKDARHSNE